MAFYKFTIVETNDTSTHDRLHETKMIINERHIVSIKPINIVCGDEIIRGHWIRLTNGKKYKASRIPANLLDAFNATDMVGHGVYNAGIEGQEQVTCH